MQHPRPRLVRALLLGTALGALGILCAGSGCEVLPETEEQAVAVVAKPRAVLRIGVQSWDMPSVDETFEPIERAFEGVLLLHGQDLAVEVTSFAVYSELLTALAEGRVDVARLDAGSYQTARHRQPGVAVLAVERADSGGPRQGVIVTATHSPLQSLAALRGKSFAFGDEHTSLGHHLPQAKLLAAGLHAADLRHTRFLRRWDKVAAAVRLGEFDAGVLEMNAFRRLNTEGGLRVLAPLIDAPRPWIAREGLAPNVAAALSEALLRLDDPRCLEVLEASGFARADDKAFEPVRAAMAATVRFLAPKPEPRARPRAHGAEPARPRR